MLWGYRPLHFSVQELEDKKQTFKRQIDDIKTLNTLKKVVSFET